MLWKNHAENVHQKLVPDSFLILVNETKQPFYAGNFFKNKSLLEDYQKALEKLTLFFFQIKFFFIDKIIKNRRGLELVTSSSLDHKTSSENSFISYILSDQV